MLLPVEGTQPSCSRRHQRGPFCPCLSWSLFPTAVLRRITCYKMLLGSSCYHWGLERKEATFCHVMYLRGRDTQLWSSMGILSLSIRWANWLTLSSCTFSSLVRLKCDIHHKPRWMLTDAFLLIQFFSSQKSKNLYSNTKQMSPTISLILLPKAAVKKHQKLRESWGIHTFRKYSTLATSREPMAHKIACALLEAKADRAHCLPPYIFCKRHASPAPESNGSTDLLAHFPDGSFQVWVGQTTFWTPEHCTRQTRFLPPAPGDVATVQHPGRCDPFRDGMMAQPRGKQGCADTFAIIHWMHMPSAVFTFL